MLKGRPACPPQDEWCSWLSPTLSDAPGLPFCLMALPWGHHGPSMGWQRRHRGHRHGQQPTWVLPGSQRSSVRPFRIGSRLSWSRTWCHGQRHMSSTGACLQHHGPLPCQRLCLHPLRDVSRRAPCLPCHCSSPCRLCSHLRPSGMMGSTTPWGPGIAVEVVGLLLPRPTANLQQSVLRVRVSHRPSPRRQHPLLGHDEACATVCDVVEVVSQEESSRPEHGECHCRSPRLPAVLPPGQECPWP